MAKNDRLISELIIKGEQSRLKWMGIDEVHEDPDNPRTISKKDFANLKKSIKDFPEMMVLRPGVVDGTGRLIAGNMRHKACKVLGWSKFPVIEAKELTPDQLKEFMIKDNLGAGEWDKDILKADWDIADLKDWGLDTSIFNEFSAAGGEMEPKAKGKSTVLRLKFDADVYEMVVNALNEIAPIPEEAILQMLKERAKTPELKQNTDKA